MKISKIFIYETTQSLGANACFIYKTLIFGELYILRHSQFRRFRFDEALFVAYSIVGISPLGMVGLPSREKGSVKQSGIRRTPVSL
jgi:hypothetical protein